jgi:hypothetical protein
VAKDTKRAYRGYLSSNAGLQPHTLGNLLTLKVRLLACTKKEATMPKELTAQQKLIINNPAESIKSFLTDYFNIHDVDRVEAATIPNSRHNIEMKIQYKIIIRQSEKGVENE